MLYYIFKLVNSLSESNTSMHCLAESMRMRQGVSVNCPPAAENSVSGQCTGRPAPLSWKEVKL